MICKKCNKIMPKCLMSEEGILYCPLCKAPLREICPECGKAEAIGRAVCETKEKEAKEVFDKFKKANSEFWSILQYAGFCTLCTLFAVATYPLIAKYPILFPLTYAALMIAALASGIAFCTANSNFKSKKKLEDTFFQSHPYYAEIIKKSRGEA